MPGITAYSATNTEALRTVWDAEIGLNPHEETKIADWVEQPIGAQKFGTALKLRKIPTMTATTYSSTSTSGPRSALTYNTSTESTVTVSAIGKYSAVALDRQFLNQAIDDANYRNGYRKQLMAVLNEEIDRALFALAANLSTTESQADIDDAMVRTALGDLATNAKSKFTEGSAKLLVVHPTELKNVWNIPAIKEYQIRGTIGAAVNAQMNAYGLIWRESGMVYNNGGSYYNPLLLKDAWALCWNEKPHILDVQQDGLTENFIAYTEFGVAEWFDSSGVALITT